ncbi:MAG: DUF5009 domain-containing protein [Planctomycetota bacterium]|nr:DUF5009 domain-containing protein [Planctomycetota bacterium]
MPTPSPSAPTSERLFSLDALRGMDMLCILGVEELASALAKAESNTLTRTFAEQMEHVPWEGFHALDLVFPLFLFCSGAALAYSIPKAVQSRGVLGALGRIASRMVLLYALGVIYYGGFSKGWDEVRWVGVLQRIAICSGVVGLMLCFMNQIGRVVSFIAILVGYWLLMMFVPGSSGERSFAEGPEHNVVNWFDYAYLPGKRWDGTHDPEGVLSTIPALASCLLGALCADFVKSHPGPPVKKGVALIVGGAVLIALGWLWGLQFPVIKKLWTSSYVLVAGGWSALLFGVLYLVVDIWKLRTWALGFVWIGMNAILLYMSRRLINLDDLSAALVGGPIGELAGRFGPVLVPLGVVVLNLALARFLYQRRVFLRV